jgi:hypothetical protein
MAQFTIYIAVTSHGFGHAVRAATVAEKLQQLRPDIAFNLVTVAPEWLLKSYIKGDFVYRPRVFDVGVIQKDSLTMDRQTTLSKMQNIMSQEERIIAEEAQYIKENNIGLILAGTLFIVIGEQTLLKSSPGRKIIIVRAIAYFAYL